MPKWTIIINESLCDIQAGGNFQKNPTRFGLLNKTSRQQTNARERTQTNRAWEEGGSYLEEAGLSSSTSLQNSRLDMGGEKLVLNSKGERLFKLPNEWME